MSYYRIIRRNASPAPWSPSNLGSPLQAWYDFSDTSTLFNATSGGSNVTANDAEIFRVEDKSGRGLHLPKAVQWDNDSNVGTGYYTGIVANRLKTYAQNGLSAWESDKSNTSIPGGGFGLQNAAIGDAVTSLSAVWVDNQGGGSGLGQQYGGPFKISDAVDPTGATLRLLADIPDDNTNNLTRYAAGNGTLQSFTNHFNFGPSAWRIYVLTANYDQPTNSIRVYRNGSTTPVISTNVAGFTGNSGSGASKFLLLCQSGTYHHTGLSRVMGARLGEIIFVASDLTVNSTRQQIEGYFAHKWGLTSVLPNDHPHKNSAP